MSDLCLGRIWNLFCRQALFIQLISFHADPAHLSRFAETRRQHPPDSPPPFRRRHPCCRCRHHTHTNPHPNPFPPPPLHPTGDGDSFLPRSRPPRPRSPRLRAAASRAQCTPPTLPASLRGASGGYLARCPRVGWSSSTLVSREQRLRARVIVSRSPLFATVCRPRELSLPREGCRRSSVHRRITYRTTIL